MNMKKVIDISWLSAFTFFMLLTLSSCLEAGLDELESYNDAEIRGFKFEHRWEQTINGGNNTQLGVVSLPTNVKIEGNTVYCTITVPEAGNPSFFTKSVRPAMACSIAMVSADSCSAQCSSRPAVCLSSRTTCSATVLWSST